MPLRYGTPRHNEAFTHHDLWVSQAHPERPMEYLFVNLPNIVKDEELVEQTDIVLWCNSAVAPRAAERGRHARLGAAALAGRRRLGGLGAGHVERRRPPTPQPLRPDAVLSLPAPAASPGPAERPEPPRRAGRRGCAERTQSARPISGMSAGLGRPRRAVHRRTCAGRTIPRRPARDQGDADILRPGHPGEDGRLVAPQGLDRPSGHGSRRSSRAP